MALHFHSALNAGSTDHAPLTLSPKPPDPVHSDATEDRHAQPGTGAASPSTKRRIHALEDKLDAAVALYLQPTDDLSSLEHRIAVGQLLVEAESLGSFISYRLDERRRANSRTLSRDSADRFMRLARHEPLIRAAGLQTVKEAERLARAQEWIQWQESCAAKAKATAIAVETERRVFNEIRALPVAYQSACLKDLLGKLTRLHDLFEVSAN